MTVPEDRPLGVTLTLSREDTDRSTRVEEIIPRPDGVEEEFCRLEEVDQESPIFLSFRATSSLALSHQILFLIKETQASSSGS
jgi:hypothetical protein